MLPAELSGSWPTRLIVGGWKLGCVTNEWVVLEDACESARPEALMPSLSGLSRSRCASERLAAAAVALTGLATVKEKRSRFDPGAPEAAPAATERSDAVTVTRSPGLKGWAGVN